MVSYIKHMSPKRVRKDGLKVSVLPTVGWFPPRDGNVDVFARGVWVRDVWRVHMLPITRGTWDKG